MPWETLSNGIVLLSLENRTEEEQAWAVKISCGAPQVAMRHPGFPAVTEELEDQAPLPPPLVE